MMMHALMKIQANAHRVKQQPARGVAQDNDAYTTQHTQPLLEARLPPRAAQWSTEFALGLNLASSKALNGRR